MNPDRMPWSCARVPAPALVLCVLAALAIPSTASLAGWESLGPDPSSWQRSACGFQGTDLVTRWGAAVDPTSQPLPEHPRPMMVREGRWINLNGLWEFEAVAAASVASKDVIITDEPSLASVQGRALSGHILVPFPPESCLSGASGSFDPATTSYYWYRLPFRLGQDWDSERERLLLHFGAVDWQATVWVNGEMAGTHQGGYDSFSFDVTELLWPRGLDQEVLLLAYDPSERGPQPQGKQRATAGASPGSITYTSASGIWQTVWLEAVPARAYISSLHVINDPQAEGVVTVRVTAATSGEAGTELPVEVVVWRLSSEGCEGKEEMRETLMVVQGRSGPEGVRVEVASTERQLWAPGEPFLYKMTARLLLQPQGPVVDAVDSYFGLRSVGVGPDGAGVARPLINGRFTYLAGWLDQSYWPDGVYTAPSDEALAFDLLAARELGLNTVRLHQKVNPLRWYYHADRLGVVVMQDLPQKLHGATPETVPLFLSDLRAAMTGPVASHPSVVQWTLFNEEDCWQAFNVTEVVALAASLDNTRMIDTDSGGGANGLRLGHVNDIHSYPFPGDPMPSTDAPPLQYAMVGEYGGLGLYPPAAQQWAPGLCFSYAVQQTSDALLEELTTYLYTLRTFKLEGHGSGCIYTQATDTECECDGLLNYDRTHKLTRLQRRKLAAVHEQLIGLSAEEEEEEAVLIRQAASSLMRGATAKLRKH